MAQDAFILSGARFCASEYEDVAGFSCTKPAEPKYNKAQLNYFDLAEVVIDALFFCKKIYDNYELLPFL